MSLQQLQLPTMPISEARFKMRDAVDLARYKNMPVEITINNKSVAVLIGKELFNLVEKLINPADLMTKAEWENGFREFDQIGRALKTTPPQEWENAVDQAIQEVRQAKNQK